GWMPLPREPGCGPGAASTRRNETPLLASSQASVSPVGPAPAISTAGASRTCDAGFAAVISVMASSPSRKEPSESQHANREHPAEADEGLHRRLPVYRLAACKVTQPHAIRVIRGTRSRTAA